MKYEEAVAEARKFAIRMRLHRSFGSGNPLNDALVMATRYMALRFGREAARIRRREKPKPIIDAIVPV